MINFIKELFGLHRYYYVVCEYCVRQKYTSSPIEYMTICEALRFDGCIDLGVVTSRTIDYNEFVKVRLEFYDTGKVLFFKEISKKEYKSFKNQSQYDRH